MRKSNQGFTLIELMIVIAIIAIIAAIAIPGLLSSQRASNERNASASLKTLASAEADFRGNDRDGNKIQDFWTHDVAGLYGIQPAESAEMIKLIEISVAGSDFNAGGAGAGAPGVAAAALTYVPQTMYALASPKAGYWYRAMFSDASIVGMPEDYLVNTMGVMDNAGTASGVLWWNHSKFAFLAFPDSFSAGRSVFFINEGNTIFKRTTNGNVKPATVPPSAMALATGAGAVAGTFTPDQWPDDAVLRDQYAKLD